MNWKNVELIVNVTECASSKWKEWNKWELYNAAYVLSDEDIIQEFEDEKVPQVPMQWTDTDKKEHEKEAQRGC